MGYVEQHLLPGEKVVYRASPHWMLIGLPLFLVVWAVFVVADRRMLSDGGFSTILGLGTFAVILFISVSAGVTFFTTEFALTDRRIIAKDGLIRQRSVELPLTQVESIDVYQLPLGLILDYGTITVVGTGGTRERFRMIVGPKELRKRVQMQISEGR